MRDLLDILTAAEAIFQRGEIAILATVVRVEGSSYRMPGARMLIDSSGRRFGSVSGGCLEADVARRGRLLSPASPNSVMRYDGDDEDVAWGFGLGCRGSIEVFIERLDAMPPSLRFIQECFQQRKLGSMVTVFAIEGDFNLPVGCQLMTIAEKEIHPQTTTLQSSFQVLREKLRALSSDESYATNESPSPLPSLAEPGEEEALLPVASKSLMHADAVRCLSDRESTTVTYEVSTGRAHALVEPIQPPLPLVIFGAGHDAVPLVRAAKSLGWHVTVWDRRPGYARSDRFPEADLVTSVNPAEIELTPDTAAVVMTHHYPDDENLLPMLLKSLARYIGALGPRSRTDRILANLSLPQLERLYAPIGLDIGAEGPEQVAIAIVAEILAVFSRRPGASLRNRTGPIHPPAHCRVVMMEQTPHAAEART